MPIDYALKYPCPVRRAFPEEKLSALVGYVHLAEFAMRQARHAMPGVADAELMRKVEVNVEQRRPDGVVKQIPMTIADLVEMSQPLLQQSTHCPPCRANVGDRSFGCFGKVNYPIRRESEAWLIGRLPENGEDDGLRLLFQIIDKFDVHGGAVDRLRDELFELKAPLERAWTTPQGPRRLTSSQIIHLLAYIGDVEPNVSVYWTKALGLTNCLRDPHPPSDNIEQFKTLMCAFVMSAQLSAPLTVDP